MDETGGCRVLLCWHPRDGMPSAPLRGCPQWFLPCQAARPPTSAPRLTAAALLPPFCHRWPHPTANLSPSAPDRCAPRSAGPGGAHASEQEWLDRLMSDIMAEYQPASQAASQRAVRSLPVLAVRPKDVAGEPGEGQAVARAGEPCSVW